MAVSVADLVKFYADTPPPKSDSLADLEARLEALSSPGYRSPFKFEPPSLSPLAAGAFGTPKYGQLNAYTSVADALKAPTVPDVASLYPLHRVAGPATPGAITVSELFEQRTRASSRPLWEQLAERHGPAAGPVGFGKFLYDSGNALGRAMEALRPQLERFGMFVGGLATGIETALYVLRTGLPRDPYGNPVPPHNAGLYVLARGAYRGDWEAEAQFLNEIGADGALDSDLYLEKLLRPTFEPDRLDLRVSWEQRDPRAARRWLKKRLGEIKRGDGDKTRLLLPYEAGDEQAQTELLAFADAEAARARDTEIRSILPERQYQVLMLMAEERKQAEIAEELGIGISTVKTHAGRLRNNPDLLRALRP